MRLTEAVAKELQNVSQHEDSSESVQVDALARPVEAFEALRSEPFIGLVRQPKLYEGSAPLIATAQKPYHPDHYEHAWRPITSPARKRSADELFPRARQIPFLGIFFVGCATVWCWLRDNWEWLISVFLDPETLRQIAITFLLLASGIFPLAVVVQARRDRTANAYPRWLIVYFLCFGLVSTATGAILGIKYAQAVSANSSAEGALRRVKAEHTAAVAHLEFIWQGFSDSCNGDTELCRVLLEGSLTPDLRSELRGNVPLLVDAKITQFRDQNRAIWLKLCILGIVAGALNIVSSALLARMRD